MTTEPDPTDDDLDAILLPPSDRRYGWGEPNPSFYLIPHGLLDVSELAWGEAFFGISGFLYLPFLEAMDRREDVLYLFSRLLSDHQEAGWEFTPERQEALLNRLMAEYEAHSIE